MRNAPSRRITSPFSIGFSQTARTIAANSSGRPSLEGNGTALPRLACTSAGSPAIIGITCAILIVLFVIQPFGTAKLGTSFAPIVTVWLLFNLCSGIYNLVLHDYTVLKAFSPYFAFAYLTRNGYDGWKSLGGILLAEFGKRNQRIATRPKPAG